MALIDWKESLSKSKCAICGKPVADWAKFYPRMRSQIVRLSNGKVAHRHCYEFAGRTEFMEKVVGTKTGWHPDKERRR